MPKCQVEPRTRSAEAAPLTSDSSEGSRTRTEIRAEGVAQDAQSGSVERPSKAPTGCTYPAGDGAILDEAAGELGADQLSRESGSNARSVLQDPRRAWAVS